MCAATGLLAVNIRSFSVTGLPGSDELEGAPSGINNSSSSSKVATEVASVAVERGTGFLSATPRMMSEVCRS